MRPIILFLVVVTECHKLPNWLHAVYSTLWEQMSTVFNMQLLTYLVIGK